VDIPLLYDIIGYVGSVLVILSLMQKSILRLRVIGLIGSVVFLVYSVLIAAYPIAVVNVLAAGIHLFFLRKLVRFKEEVFSVLHVNAESRYLAYFLDYYQDEIEHRFQPDFTYRPGPDQFVAFILRDLVPAGLFIGRLDDDRSIEVELDFVIPQYRDFKIGPFLYSPASGVFEDPRCKLLWVTAATKDQRAYFERMGFQPAPTADNPDRYIKDLDSIRAAA